MNAALVGVLAGGLGLLVGATVGALAVAGRLMEIEIHAEAARRAVAS